MIFGKKQVNWPGFLKPLPCDFREGVSPEPYNPCGFVPDILYNKGLHVEEVTVYRNLYGRSEAETYKLDKGRGEAEFLYRRCTVRLPLRHRTRLYPVLKLTKHDEKTQKRPKIDPENVEI